MTPGPRQRNREAERLQQALDVMRPACFRLSCGGSRWGTGFFIAPDLALTAWHNVADALRGQFDAWLGEVQLRFSLVKERSSRDTDVAVLRLVHAPAGFEAHPLEARRLNPMAPRQDRDDFFAGRRVAVYGCPFIATGQDESLFAGGVDLQMPFVDLDEKSAGGYGAGIAVRVRRFKIVANGQGPSVPGASGSPVLDMDELRVLGVLGSYSPDGGLLYATDLGSWLSDLRQRGGDATEMERTVALWHGEPGALSTGFAAFVRDGGHGGPLAVPVTVRFTYGSGPSGMAASGDETLSAVAASAVEWAGGIVRGLSGPLREAVEQNHWGKAPYGLAVFRVERRGFESHDTLRAAMGLAWLDGVLRACAVHDLKLPLERPGALALCAAGLALETSLVSGFDGLADAVSGFPYSDPALVFFARSQEREKARMTLPPGAEVRLLPADTGIDLARHLFGSWLGALPSAPVKQHYRDLFTGALGEWLDARRRIEDAGLSSLGREARLNEAHGRFTVAAREIEYLKQQVGLARAARASGQPLPLRSEIAGELDGLRQLWLGEAGLITVVEPQTETEREELRACRKLYLKLATFVHPDKTKQEDLPEPMRFHVLKERSQDLVYLRSMHGALAPVALSGGASVEDRVSEMFAQVFALRDVYADLRARIAADREEADALGEPWRMQLDTDIEAAEKAARVAESKNDALWWELGWVLGEDPISRGGAH